MHCEGHDTMQLKNEGDSFMEEYHDPEDLNDLLKNNRFNAITRILTT